MILTDEPTERLKPITMPEPGDDIKRPEPMTDEAILQSLAGNICPGYCGGKKARYQTFCRSEYFALPKLMQSDLYDGFNDGYQEAFNAARAYLLELKK